jgi:hemoglobin/transferrin/lactoferrin receptor protein
MRDLPGLKTLTYTLLLAASPLTITSVMAQDASSTWLDTINVTGTRTEKTIKDSPRSVTVISKEELEKKAPESIAEMLRDVPGVEVVDSSAAGMKRIRIRGESSRRVTILVDGQEITDHSTYGTPILVNPSGIERIDIIRGPASVLYGAKAIGGVVNIITKKGSDKPVQLELGGSYYSGSKGWQGWAALSGTVENFDYRLSGGLADHKDRSVPSGRYTSTGKLDGTSFNTDDIALHLGYKFGADQNHYFALKADQHRLDTESWTDPATLTGGVTDFNIDLPQRDRRKLGLFYDATDLSPLLRKVHVDGYFQTIDRLFDNNVTVTIPQPTVRTVDVMSTSDDTITDYGGTVQADFKFDADHYTIFGAQYLSDNLETAKTSVTTMVGFGPSPMTISSASEDEAVINTISLFAQDEWSITPTLKLTTGLRYYHTETELESTTDPSRANYQGGEGDKLLKSAGLTYSGITDTTFRVLYSEGYITPTLLQLFSYTTAGGETVYGNPDLEAETSQNYEIGMRYEAGGFSFDGTAYYTEAKDYIATLSCGGAIACPSGSKSSESIYANVNTAVTHGVEVAVQYAIPETGFTPYATGTWTKRKYEFPTFSTYNTDTPELSGRFGVKYDWQLAGGKAWADLYTRVSNGVKETDADGDTDSLPGWATLNLGLGATFGEDDKYQLALNLHNLTNKEYRASLGEIPGTGRSVVVTTRVKF